MGMDKYAYMHKFAHAHTDGHTYRHTHTRTHTHKNTYIIYCPYASLYVFNSRICRSSTRVQENAAIFVISCFVLESCC